MVASSLCQFSSYGLRQYLSALSICSIGTIATLFFRCPIAKLVYPLINPWMLHKAIWQQSLVSNELAGTVRTAFWESKR